MKKILILFILLLTASLGFSQNLSGSWKGTLDLGVQKLALVFHLQKDAQGKVTCTMDSLDQNARGIPVSLAYISPDSIHIEAGQLGMSYVGKLQGGTIHGRFSQNGINLPLDLQPGQEIRNRPQTPKAPFDYPTEEVVFTNVKAQATLSGTLTYPKDYQKGMKVPVVLLVSGSGLQNRDEGIFGHQPFLVIADYFAHHGIATLRYDDRGYGHSTGDASNATTADFAEDAAAGVEWLKKTGKFCKIGVLGHSEGASIAFMLGARSLVDFVISMAGIGVKGDTALTAQSNKITELMGHPVHFSVSQYRANVALENRPWLNYFINYDPASDIGNTRCPVMAINGSKDTQVLPDLNLTAIRKLLPDHRHNLIREYPGLNHLFQTCKTGLPSEYPDLEETMSPEVLNDLAKWINSL